VKDIPKRLAERLSQLKNPNEKDRQSKSERIKPDINESTIDIFLGDAVSRLVDEQELVEKVLRLDKNSDELDQTVPDLKILDPDSSDTDKSTGFDLYDTGVFQKK